MTTSTTANHIASSTAGQSEFVLQANRLRELVKNATDNNEDFEYKTAISGHPKFVDGSASPRSQRRQQGDVALSPYKLNSDDVDKYFMSGYKGFVPRLNFMMGASYPFLTHDALNEFTAARTSRDLRNRRPAFHQFKSGTLSTGGCSGGGGSTTRHAPVKVPPKALQIYRRDQGLIPNYHGFIPNYKFKCGGSFYRMTTNSMNRGPTPSNDNGNGNSNGNENSAKSSIVASNSAHMLKNCKTTL